MWTSEILSVNRAGGEVIVNVEFSDGTTTWRRDIRVGGGADFDVVKRQISDVIKSMESQDTLVTQLPLGDFDSSITEPVVTAADEARQVWLTKYYQWLQISKAIDAGILVGDEAPVVARLNELKTDFLSDYLPYL